MTIRLEKETEVPFDIEYEQIANEVVQAALDYVECPYECEVNILLTDNDGIQITNHAMRKKNVPTDVLSFPMIEFDKEGDFSVADNDISLFNADTGELLLGDIMISIEKVLEQAEQFNHSKKREYAFLIAHSILHLSGYDHIQEEERMQMEQMQEEILQQIGYTREITD